MKRHPAARQLGEAVRRACVEAALAAYEDAAISGLCHEGAWEAAVSAIRGLDLDALAEATVPADTEPVVAAESAAAGTGAIAAGLLERTAALSALCGPEGFRKRARSIASWATSLQSSLRTAARADAELQRSRPNRDLARAARMDAEPALHRGPGRDRTRP